MATKKVAKPKAKTAAPAAPPVVPAVSAPAAPEVLPQPPALVINGDLTVKPHHHVEKLKLADKLEQAKNIVLCGLPINAVSVIQEVIEELRK